MKVEVWNFGEKQIKVIIKADELLEEFDELKEIEMGDTIDLQNIMRLVEMEDAE